ncbi:MAG: hypothetical protein HUK09_06665 [Bacteroidaceae bacterium]|nr:hypothetical protein [Bacteroidaceae bacterium]
MYYLFDQLLFISPKGPDQPCLYYLDGRLHEVKEEDHQSFFKQCTHSHYWDKELFNHSRIKIISVKRFAREDIESWNNLGIAKVLPYHGRDYYYWVIAHLDDCNTEGKPLHFSVIFYNSSELSNSEILARVTEITREHGYTFSMTKLPPPKLIGPKVIIFMISSVLLVIYLLLLKVGAYLIAN